MIRIIICLIAFLFLLPTAISYIMINEVMYNPAGTDSNKEFIEIYHTPWTNLTDYYISDGKKNESLILININKSSNYSLIIEDDSILNLPNITIYVTDSTIGSGGLNNDETVFLFDDSLNLTDSVPINSSIANNNGYSMEYFNGSFYESIIINGTPGYENSISQGIPETPPQEAINIILKTYLDDVIYINTKYTKLFKIKIDNKDNCSEKDSVTVSYNITNTALIKQDEFTKEVGCSGYASTGEFTPTQAGNYTLCGIIIDSTINETYLLDNSACKDFEVVDISSIPCNLSINITVVNERDLYENKEKIKFKNNLNDKTYPFIIEYWIEDLFGNIVKKKYNTTNTNQKTYTPDIDEIDQVLIIKNQLHPYCNDQNLSDNTAEKMIIIKNTDIVSKHSGDSSEITIEKLMDLSNNKAKFGQTVRAKVTIYKGNTAKYSISSWVEDSEGTKLSKQTKFNLYKKYQSYSLAIPVQIKPNCNEGFDDDEYDFIMEGIGIRSSKKIEIAGITSSLCDERLIYVEKTSSTQKTKKGVSYSVIDCPDEIGTNQFKVSLEIENNDNSGHTFDVWSYVYRGSKSYTGEREKNKKTIFIQEYQSKVIQLENNIEAEPGSYKLKVNIKKDNQKTNKEIIREISIPAKVLTQEPEKDKVILEPEKTQADHKQAFSTTPYAKVIYESSNERTKKLIPFFIIILLTLLVIVFIWRR